MVNFIIRAAFGALGLWLAAQLLSGVNVSSTTVLIIAAVLLGLVNAVIRPIVVILTLPFTIITLGLFLLVVNAAMIGLVAAVIPGFSVDGLGSGIMAAIITGLVSWAGSVVAAEPKKG
ncbi:MAG: phage holin family protein [Phenylobacterium sp.]|uniref:phage holin family protein n=1 Tax=Phenylobacterium sp. TaxID=1871053 RepID=UPI00391DC76F